MQIAKTRRVPFPASQRRIQPPKTAREKRRIVLQRKRTLSSLQMTAAMVGWYTEQHLTLREIGRLYEVSATAVMKRLRKAGVTRADGEHVTRPCGFCGAEVTRTRSQGLRRNQLFCSGEHYYASLENPDFQEWRQGSRQARAAVASHYPLTREQVVHHKNGNQRENNIANLSVFASQAEHMAFHRGRASTPVWDGASVRA